ncbi:hypothetical protein [Microbulbifer sp. THAF38]|uniref:hypothetical protein n=1 Tax=Microbulbifer sp. THAF38 TaxID=2587856 RepID=UPI001267C363|nr:hypothetical protein [Microbulbifer sp. THAF38]QFT56611.1 hypothetical protein FIU95_18850 [Microbulbifer sp. THAF38]
MSCEQPRTINRDTPVAIGLVIMLCGAVFSFGMFWSKWQAIEHNHKNDIARLDEANRRLEEKTDRRFENLQNSIDQVGADVNQVKNFLMRNPVHKYEKN